MIKATELQTAAHYADLAYRENISVDKLRQFSAHLSGRLSGHLSGHRTYRNYETGFTYVAKYESWASATMFWLDLDKNYLIFRGTADPSDILLDICVVPARYLGSWVHAGMALAHKSIKKKILKVLGQMDHSKPLVLTGHSMGGSLSELTHLLCQREGVESKCITFGKPRAFLRPLKKRFPKNSMFSVVSSSDLITRLPRYLFNHGCSDQNLFYLASDGNNYLNPDMSFVRDDFKLHRGLRDHSMKMYKESLGRIS